MYILDGQQIRNPFTIKELNNTQVAVQRALSGALGRDFFGNNKRTFVLSYTNIKKTEYDVIYAIYISYLNTGSTKTFSVTDTNYTISSVLVHIDLPERDFSVRGSDYLSDIDITLSEA